MFTTAAPSLHAHTPIWHNPQLPEMMTVPDHNIWVAHRIIYLSQVISGSVIRSFQALKDKFALPNHMLFRYL